MSLSWLETYQRLTQQMYDIRRRCPGLVTLGVSTLHPRHSPPPEHLQLVEVLRRTTPEATPQRRGAGGALPSPMWLLARWLWCVLYAARDTCQIVWMKARFASRLRRLQREPATIILKTLVNTMTPSHGAPDFYYGTLPDVLARHEVSCVLLCGDGRARVDSAFARMVLTDRARRMVPEYLVAPWWVPLVTAGRQLGTARALRRLAARAPSDEAALVCASAARTALEPFTQRHVMLFYAAREAVRTWRAKAFVSLYEGQPWEMLARHGVKAADPSCVTVGYQHTVVMPYSLSLLHPSRDSWELATPEVVLCSGPSTCDMMRRGHASHHTRLVPFGSYRRAPMKATASYAPNPERKMVLVLPEGILREARLMFDFAMRVAPLAPDHQFILRCHPVQPFAQVLPHLAAQPEQFGNLRVSTAARVEEEFARASVVLHRGSSAVLYAVLHGLKPIYLHQDGFPDVNPLFDLSEWGRTVSTPAEMADALGAWVRTPTPELRKSWEHAREYVERYAQPVDENSVARFLSAVGLFHEITSDAALEAVHG